MLNKISLITLLVIIILTCFNCAWKSSPVPNSENITVYTVCIENHLYYYSLRGGLALKVTNDGKPINCEN
jgi:hypothetical protein